MPKRSSPIFLDPWSKDDPQAQAQARINSDHDYVNIINGRPVTAEQTAPVYNPATGEVTAHVPVTSKEQLDEAVATARAAFPAWSARPVEERQAVVSAIGDRLEGHAKNSWPC